MKALILAIALSGMLGFEGCATHKPVAASIPNQTSTLDGEVYRGLRDVQAAIDTYKIKVGDGTFHPTAAMSAQMLDLTKVYNDAYEAWTLYHADTSTQASTASALQAKYQMVQDQYQGALEKGAPLPPAATIGAK